MRPARPPAAGTSRSRGGRASCTRRSTLDLVEELVLHVAPVLLGSGTRLFEDARPRHLQILKTIAAEHATHIRYAV